MLYPSLQNMLKHVNSRYLLVNIIAKRARDIANMNSGYDDLDYDKPVSQAIEEIAAGELRVAVPDDL
ncbi:MAG: DNA-directed RNA polymerase subunit omega [Oscillospiraceae bacterium]|nr:DNA-directed RNA polymerase subunit omega [Oscillospiraceae bacterium]MCL2278324.1 DNA-directed RNA polymerase subunit omega [Oscillospiraceae bacterium]